MSNIECECVCGSKLNFFAVEGFVGDAPCEVCGRYGVYMLKGGKLLFNGPDSFMQELEARGFKKVETSSGPWIELEKWRFTEES